MFRDYKKMAKVLSWIYGLILIALGIISFFGVDVYGVNVTGVFMIYAVGGMGVLILFTKIVPYSALAGAPAATGKVGAFVRRWVFGIVLIIMAVQAYVQPGALFFDFSYVQVGSTGGSILLMFLGVMYIVAGMQNWNKSWALKTH
jgi:hypothetical protein